MTYNHDRVFENILNRQALSNILKKKAQNDICKKPSKLLHTELKKYINSLSHYDCTFIKNNIHHARKSVLPKISTNLDEVHNVLKELNIKTNRYE